MSYDSFTIRRISDDSEVDLDKVDRLVCEHFGIVYNDHDYAMLHFSESDKESGGITDPIAWTVLLHNVIRHSSLTYGRQGRYALLGALEYMRFRDEDGFLPEFEDQRVIRLLFPPSSKRLLAQLLYCLEKEGYYIFVSYPDYMIKMNLYSKVMELAKESFMEFVRNNRNYFLSPPQWTELSQEGFPVKFDRCLIKDGGMDLYAFESIPFDVTPLAEKISLELLKLDEPLDRCEIRLRNYAKDCIAHALMKGYRYLT